MNKGHTHTHSTVLGSETNFNDELDNLLALLESMLIINYSSVVRRIHTVVMIFFRDVPD